VDNINPGKIMVNTTKRHFMKFFIVLTLSAFVSSAFAAFPIECFNDQTSGDTSKIYMWHSLKDSTSKRQAILVTVKTHPFNLDHKVKITNQEMIAKLSNAEFARFRNSRKGILTLTNYESKTVKAGVQKAMLLNVDDTVATLAINGDIYPFSCR
jgi:hypothetical protein